jgi:hypothetical protein
LTKFPRYIALQSINLLVILALFDLTVRCRHALEAVQVPKIRA